MDVKVSELSDAALDWAVEEAQGFGSVFLKFWNEGGDKRFVQCKVIRNNSTNWAAAGPIIERERISVISDFHEIEEGWLAESYTDSIQQFGPTPLIAAMRCYVASKLGDVVSVPDELL